MILHYTSLKHVTIFDNNGFLKEHTLLLNIINKSSINKFLEIIKILKERLFRILKIKIDFFKDYISFINDFKLLEDIKLFDKVKSKVFIMKKFYFLYFQKMFSVLAEKKSLVEIKTFSKDLFFKLKDILHEKKNFCKDNFFLPLNLKNKFHEFTKNENIFCEYNSFIFKNKVTKYVNNLYEREIFVAGSSCDYYQGNITPFYKSQTNWLVSTGLKTDIECYQPEVPSLKEGWDEFIEEDILFEDIYEPYFFVENARSRFKRIVFKVYNFNKKINNSFKGVARHLFLYRLVNFLGKQKYINESKTTFNFKQIYTSYNLLLFNLNIYTLNKNFILINFLSETKFNYNFSFVKNLFLTKFIKLVNSNNKFTLEMKLVFLLFKSLNFNLNYYNSLNKDIYEVLNKSGNFYGHLVSFLRVQETYYITLKNIILNNILYISKVYFKLDFLNNFKNLMELKYLKDKEKEFKFFFFIFKIFLLNFKFLKLFKKSIIKSFYLNECFDSFIEYNKKEYLNQRIITDEDLKSNELISCYKKISFLKTYDIYKLYFFFFYYVRFLIEWKININIILFSKYKGNLIFEDILLQRIDKRFKKLKELFETLMYTHVKNFYLNFIVILLDLIDAFKELFYSLGSFYTKKMNFETYFCFSNLFIYLNKWIDSYSLNHNIFEEDSKFNGILNLTSLINFSDLFLGKWFFSRHLTKFFDISYNYSNIYSLNTNIKSNLKFKFNNIFSQLVKKQLNNIFFFNNFFSSDLSQLEMKTFLKKKVKLEKFLYLFEKRLSSKFKNDFSFHFNKKMIYDDIWSKIKDHYYTRRRGFSYKKVRKLQDYYNRSRSHAYIESKVDSIYNGPNRLKSLYRKEIRYWKRQRRIFSKGKYYNTQFSKGVIKKGSRRRYRRHYTETLNSLSNVNNLRNKSRFLFSQNRKFVRILKPRNFDLDEVIRNNNLNLILKNLSKISLFKSKVGEYFNNNNLKYYSKDLFNFFYFKDVKDKSLFLMDQDNDQDKGEDFNYCHEDFDFNFVINKLFFVDMFLILYRNKNSKNINSTHYYNFWYNNG